MIAWINPEDLTECLVPDRDSPLLDQGSSRPGFRTL
jgi:hypothetical protein